jgi:hypothetical protein
MLASIQLQEEIISSVRRHQFKTSISSLSIESYISNETEKEAVQ